MSDFVWICCAPSDPSLADGILKTDIAADGDERILAIAKITDTGGVLDPARLPTRAWGEVGPYRAHHFPGHWPDLSRYAGLWIVSGKVAGILRAFDLGEGVIANLRLYERDGSTPVPGDWFVWNIGNVKTAFLPQLSQNVRPVPGRSWRTLGAKDHDLKCSTAAIAGPSIWLDPQLRGVFFVSNALGHALIEAELATEKAGFGQLMKCDVVAG
jgi:hypothetical protein